MSIGRICALLLRFDGLDPELGRCVDARRAYDAEKSGDWGNYLEEFLENGSATVR